ncbi:hypothetical protein PUN28_015032 [Cardiocondyla obscurior]|uniref:Uncharacterized protein n=1 Tax=Cardiocondyla obscurior TaxID=286306 RepID=A0AAW2EZQ9_9HYME
MRKDRPSFGPQACNLLPLGIVASHNRFVKEMRDLATLNNTAGRILFTDSKFVRGISEGLRENRIGIGIEMESEAPVLSSSLACVRPVHVHSPILPIHSRRFNAQHCCVQTCT